MQIIASIVVIGLLGLAFGIFLAYASKKFEVHVDERIEKLLEILPGANCGACGEAGCAGYADAIINNDVPINKCTPGGETVIEEITKIVGVKKIEINKKVVARVLCQGDNLKSKKKYEFDNCMKTCAQASLLFFGDKDCIHGCLGYGDCEKKCQFGAIKVNEKGIAIVNEEICVGCGACIKTCPKKIIKMHPKKKKTTVLCSSKLDGMESKSVCNISCVGCGICEKTCPVDAIKVNDNLAKINYEKCIDCKMCSIKCPTNAIKSDIKELKIAEINKEKCIGCGICKKACPIDAIDGIIKKKHSIKYFCIGCGKCFEKCPVQAIQLHIK